MLSACSASVIVDLINLQMRPDEGSPSRISFPFLMRVGTGIDLPQLTTGHKKDSILVSARRYSMNTDCQTRVQLAYRMAIHFANQLGKDLIV
jgi:hypothetical protein